MASQEQQWFSTWVSASSAIGKLVVAWPSLEIVTCNRAAERLLGCLRETWSGTSLPQWGIPSQSLQAILNSDSDSHDLCLGRHELIRRDGTSFQCSIDLQVGPHSPPSLLGIALVASPPSDSQVHANIPDDRIFRAVAECTYDWETWLDPSGHLVWINPAVERLTGYTVDECFAWSEYPFDVLAPEDHSMFRELLNGAKQGSSGNDIAFRIVTKPGGYKWFAVSWQPLRDQSKHAIGIRMSMRDISDRKAMEEALRSQSQHLEELASVRARTIIDLEQRKLHMQKLADLGQLAACIAHEINNPMAGIKNALRLIRGREELQPNNQQLLALVDKEMTRITALLNQMYQLGQPTLSTPTPLCLVNLLTEVVALVEPQFAAQQISIRLLDGPAKWVGEVRESEVKQILHNLLLNACEASPDAGVVDVRIKCEPSWIQLEVIDRGQGIPESLKPHLFEPFVTARQSSKRKGMGLGLSIANSLSEALGGTLQAESTVGKGTTFSLRLPWTPSLRPIPCPP